MAPSDDDRSELLDGDALPTETPLGADEESEARVEDAAGPGRE